jgi:hypothetical protein
MRDKHGLEEMAAAQVVRALSAREATVRTKAAYRCATDEPLPHGVNGQPCLAADASTSGSLGLG